MSNDWETRIDLAAAEVGDRVAWSASDSGRRYALGRIARFTDTQIVVQLDGTDGKSGEVRFARSTGKMIGGSGYAALRPITDGAVVNDRAAVQWRAALKRIRAIEDRAPRDVVDALGAIEDARAHLALAEQRIRTMVAEMERAAR